MIQLKKVKKRRRTKDNILQDQIEELVKVDELRKSLAREARALDDSARGLKAELLSRLKQGAQVEKGDYAVEVAYKAGRVSWKEAFIRECGTEKVEECVANEPETEFLEVIVR